jgi:hypothetical protein
MHALAPNKLVTFHHNPIGRVTRGIYLTITLNSLCLIPIQTVCLENMVACAIGWLVVAASYAATGVAEIPCQTLKISARIPWH